ncbi:MAG TPA: hypothetical protein VN428_04540 [Bryobacteraceae bacterium]|nr:hypothetical protein [Bryobacteraceae bacterium]
MDPITGKAAARGAAQARTGSAASQTQKTAPSKFDELRSELVQRLADQSRIPPEVKISPQQQAALRNDLEKKLSQSSPQQVHADLRVERARAENSIENVRRTITELPAHSAFDPIRSRLQSIETQFAGTGKLLGNLGKLDDPESLLKVQMQLYEVTKNMEVLSKVVDSVNSGIKTILQTQV